MGQNHFLDTNIIVGSELHWNTHHRALNDYLLKVQATRHISSFVSKECTRVLGNNRRYVAQFLDQCLDEVGNFNAMSTMSIAREIERVKKKLFETQQDMLYKGPQDAKDRQQEEFSLRNSEKIIDSFARNNQRLIQAAIEFTALKTYSLEVSHEVNEAIKRVNKNCCTVEEIPFHMHYVQRDDFRGFSEKESKLAEKISNRDDVRILLEAYYIIEKTLCEDTCFVTIDQQDIITNRTHIEKNLTGLKVREPNEFNATST
jgi:hypothetical protein